MPDLQTVLAAVRGPMTEEAKADLIAGPAVPEQKVVPKEQLEAAVANCIAPADEEGALKPICAVPDFAVEAALLKKTGADVSDEFIAHIHWALKNLGTQEGVSKLRFWGQLTGSEKTYYIAEGQTEAAEEDGIEDDSVEAHGTGANTMTYWVTNNYKGGEWTRLPRAQSKFIVSAKEAKRFFTGNLDAEVHTHPYFKGKTEKNLLRSCIALIAARTTICPKGYLNAEEGGEIVEAEDYKFPSVQDLSNLANWVHCRPAINMAGLTTYPEFDEEAEEHTEQALALRKLQLLDTDAKMPPLSAVTTDGSESWFSATHGDQTNYKFTTVVEDEVVAVNKCYGVAQVSSLLWPGAVTACQGSHFANFYFGNGQVNASLPAPPPANVAGVAGDAGAAEASEPNPAERPAAAAEEEAAAEE